MTTDHGTESLRQRTARVTMHLPRHEEDVRRDDRPAPGAGEGPEQQWTDQQWTDQQSTHQQSTHQQSTHQQSTDEQWTDEQWADEQWTDRQWTDEQQAPADREDGTSGGRWTGDGWTGRGAVAEGMPQDGTAGDVPWDAGPESGEQRWDEGQGERWGDGWDDVEQGDDPFPDARDAAEARDPEDLGTSEAIPAPQRAPWWHRLGGAASVSVVCVLQLVLATAVGVVVSEQWSTPTKAWLVTALVVAVALAVWPVGDRRAVLVVADVLAYVWRRVVSQARGGADDGAPVMLPPLVVGRADGPEGPEMGVVHDGSGWAAVVVVGGRGHGQGVEDPPATWLPETVEALGRAAGEGREVQGAQVLLECDARGAETLVAVRVDPTCSPAGGVIGGIDGVAPLLRHRVRRLEEALEPDGLTVRTLDPAEVVAQLQRSFALDDADLDTDTDPQAEEELARSGEHRTCVVSTRGMEQVCVVRSSAATPFDRAFELESVALRLPGRVTVAVDVDDTGWPGDTLVRVGVGRDTGPTPLTAALRRAMPPGAELLVPHFRQAPRYAETLPLGRRR